MNKCQYNHPTTVPIKQETIDDTLTNSQAITTTVVDDASEPPEHDIVTLDPLNLETLNHLQHELQIFQVDKALDEDQIIHISRQLNRSVLKRNYTNMDKKLNGSNGTNNNSKESYETVYTVDNDFFHDIIDGVIDRILDNETKASKTPKMIHSMDESTLEKLKDDLGIEPHKRWSRRTDVIDDIAHWGISCKSMLYRGSDERRLTRGMIRGSQGSSTETNDSDGITKLLEASKEVRIEIELERQLYKKNEKDFAIKENDGYENSEVIDQQEKKRKRTSNGDVDDDSSTTTNGTKGVLPMAKRPKQNGKSITVTGVIINGEFYGFDEDKSRSKRESTSVPTVAELELKSIPDLHFDRKKERYVQSDSDDERQSKLDEQIPNHIQSQLSTSTPLFGSWQRQHGDRGLIPDVRGIQADIGSYLLSKSNSHTDSMITPKSSSDRLHSNATYGDWSSKLLNCLQGNGRNMTRYEFFYSDIDRGWFNSNQYQRDLAKMGIPSNAKFSKSEWGLIRRKVRKKPRRFTSRFVRQQFRELKDYRKFSRSIHKKVELDGASSHKFDSQVPGPIKVGSIVTAYSKKSGMLHRGTVLTRTTAANSYFIQFERKELGCEECPDFDVASHGAPAMMKAQNAKDSIDNDIGTRNGQMGKLPYGTSYGSLVEFQLDSPTSNNNSTTTGSPNSQHINARIERKILMKLICIVETTMKRKQRILQVLEELNSKFEEEMNDLQGRHDDGADVSQRLRMKIFTRSTKWLYHNLRLNEQALEFAMIHLKVLYQNPLSTDRSLLQHQKEKKVEYAIQSEVSVASTTPPTTNKDTINRDIWDKKMQETSVDIASLLNKSVLKKDVDQSGGHQDKTIEGGLRANFLKSRFNSAAELLMSSLQAEHNSTIPSGTVQKTMRSAMGYLKPHNTMPEMSLLKTSAARRNEFTALLDTIDSLCTECHYTASH